MERFLRPAKHGELVFGESPEFRSVTELYKSSVQYTGHPLLNTDLVFQHTKLRHVMNRISHDQLRVTYIHQYFETPDQFGGLRGYKNALHLVKRGHRVTVISGSRSYHSSASIKRSAQCWLLEETIDGIEVVWVDPLFHYHRSFSHRMLSFLMFMILATLVGLRIKSDVVYVTSPPLTVILPGLFISKVRKSKLVFEVRDIWPESAITAGVLRNTLIIKLAKLLESFAYRFSDRIVTVSEGIADALSRRGIDRRKLRVVHHGADLEYLNCRDADQGFRERYGLKDKFVAIYAGSFGWANDLQTVLMAADLLRGHPNISIVLLGDGREKTNLVNLGKTYRLSNLVFADPVPKREIASAIGAADAGLMILRDASTFSTVLPNKLLDYMACGLPVVINFEGYASRLVEKAKSGILVEPNSPEAICRAILQLAEAPQLCQKMGESGRKFVMKNYSRETAVKQFEKVLLESLQVK